MVVIFIIIKGSVFDALYLKAYLEMYSYTSTYIDRIMMFYDVL